MPSETAIDEIVHYITLHLSKLMRGCCVYCALSKTKYKVNLVDMYWFIYTIIIYLLILQSNVVFEPSGIYILGLFDLSILYTTLFWHYIFASYLCNVFLRYAKIAVSCSCSLHPIFAFTNANMLPSIYLYQTMLH